MTHRGFHLHDKSADDFEMIACHEPDCGLLHYDIVETARPEVIIDRLHYLKRTKVDSTKVHSVSYAGVDYDNPCTDADCELGHVEIERDADD